MSKSPHIMLNGKFLSYDALFIGANSEILNTGIFIKLEMRGCSGKMFFFDKYYNLLLKTFDFLNIPYSLELSKEIIESDIFSLLQKNRIYQGAEVQLIIYPEKEDKLNVLITGKASQSGFQINTKGVELIVDSDIKIVNHHLNQYPIPALHANTNMFKESHELTNDLTLYVNDLGDINTYDSETFFVNDKTILTPSLNHVSKFSIYRDIIINLALKSGFRVFDDCSIKPNDLLEMDEIFSFKVDTGFTWVSAYKERRYFNKTSALLNERLNVFATKSITS